MGSAAFFALWGIPICMLFWRWKKEAQVVFCEPPRRVDFDASVKQAKPMAKPKMAARFFRTSRVLPPSRSAPTQDIEAAAPAPEPVHGDTFEPSIEPAQAPEPAPAPAHEPFDAVVPFSDSAGPTKAPMPPQPETSEASDLGVGIDLDAMIAMRAARAKRRAELRAQENAATPTATPSSEQLIPEQLDSLMIAE
jgi:hypothetical protein